MSQRARTVRTLVVLALSMVLAGALLAGLLLPWVGGPALLASQSTGLLGDAAARAHRRPAAGQHRRCWPRTAS